MQNLKTKLSQLIGKFKNISLPKPNKQLQQFFLRFKKPLIIIAFLIIFAIGVLASRPGWLLYQLRGPIEEQLIKQSTNQAQVLTWRWQDLSIAIESQDCTATLLAEQEFDQAVKKLFPVGWAIREASVNAPLLKSLAEITANANIKSINELQANCTINLGLDDLNKVTLFLLQQSNIEITPSTSEIEKLNADFETTRDALSATSDQKIIASASPVLLQVKQDIEALENKQGLEKLLQVNNIAAGIAKANDTMSKTTVTSLWESQLNALCYYFASDMVECTPAYLTGIWNSVNFQTDQRKVIASGKQQMQQTLTKLFTPPAQPEVEETPNEQISEAD